jgi:ribokinase
MNYIIVIGSLNMGLVFQAAVIPKPGETVLGNNYAHYPGGAGANQAVKWPIYRKGEIYE